MKREIGTPLSTEEAAEEVAEEGLEPEGRVSLWISWVLI
jgi:hypothetical protein